MLVTIGLMTERSAHEPAAGETALTAEQWLAAFAAKLGVPAPSPNELAKLLELAAEAAHSSERRAAPVACWLAAQAGTDPAEALELARAVTAPRS